MYNRPAPLSLSPGGTSSRTHAHFSTGDAALLSNDGVQFLVDEVKLSAQSPVFARQFAAAKSAPRPIQPFTVSPSAARNDKGVTTISGLLGLTLDPAPPTPNAATPAAAPLVPVVRVAESSATLAKALDLVLNSADPFISYNDETTPPPPSPTLSGGSDDDPSYPDTPDSTHTQLADEGVLATLPVLRLLSSLGCTRTLTYALATLKVRVMEDQTCALAAFVVGAHLGDTDLCRTAIVYGAGRSEMERGLAACGVSGKAAYAPEAGSVDARAWAGVPGAYRAAVARAWRDCDGGWARGNRFVEEMSRDDDAAWA